MTSKGKILVTGGAGFIGSHTVVELINAGYEPVIVDNFSNSLASVLDGLKNIIHKDVPCHKVDCTDYLALKEVFRKEKFSGVIHFAAFKAVGESVKEPLKYYHNNVGGLVTLLRVMEEFDVNQLVFSSSCTVYAQPDKLPVDESTPRKAQSPYGNTKKICEEILDDYLVSNQKAGIVSLRYFNPIGAHPTGHIGELPLGVPNNLVPYITQTAAGQREKLTVFGGDYNTPDGTCIRDYIHVCDLASAHVKALEVFEKISAPVHEIVNVGTGQGNTVLEVIKAFEKVSGEKLNYYIGERRSGDVEQIYASTQKAKEMLGWEAQYNIEDCMKDAWNWQKNLKNLNVEIA
ncbi:UDP-glucose 4-epimerase GalE [Cytophagaceae bacterium ABcell3]|nr:UDP-glucose 4-epimerase GalE [Cytophagaceae bacterium ABcell3]